RAAMANKHDIDTTEMERIIRGEHSDPFQFLGAHPTESGGKSAIVIRAFLPHAAHAEILQGGEQVISLTPLPPLQMTRVHAEGIFEAIIPGTDEILPYRLHQTLP